MLYDFILSLLTSYIILRFLSLCLGMRVSKKWIYLFVLILLVEAIVVNCLLNSINLAFIAPIIICYIYTYFCLNGNIKNKVFYILIAFLLSYGLEVAVFYLLVYLSQNNYLPTDIGYLAKFISKIILIILMLIFNKLILNKKVYLSNYKASFLAPPILAIIVIFIIIRMFDFNDKNYLIMMFLLCMFIIIISLIFTLMQITLLEANTKYIETLLENKIKQQELESYAKVKKTFDFNKKLEHDLHKHFNIIKSYIVDNNYEEACNYLDKVEQTISLSNQTYTSNRVLNYILNYNVNYNPNIKFVINITHDLSFIDDIDLTSILGNMLANAIEATEKVVGDKIISVDIYRKEFFVIILIKNPTILNSEDLKILKTTKRDKNNHGFGIKTITNKVSKYDGYFVYFVDNNKFIAKCVFGIDNN